MAEVIYRVGYENRVVVEEKDFDESIFSDQYLHALKLVNGFVNQSLPENLQIVAFCGDRGSGKSSCMKTVIRMLEEKQKLQKRKGIVEEYLRDHRFYGLLKTSFEIPQMIDPAFFDGTHNIIELVIGQIYNDLIEYEQANKLTLDRLACKDAHEALSKVRACLLTIHGSVGQSFNDYAELSVLSNSVRLKEEIAKMVESYLRVTGKDKLLIAVDDLDLNIAGAFEMCEQIRKYLAMPKCVIFISFDYSQMLSAIISSLSKTYENVKVEESRINELALRYLDKFVSSGERVYMPRAYDLCNRTLRIIDTDGKGHIRPEGENKVMEVVVNLIFQKTRFLFYNSKGGVSPIVPDNLRKLFQLLGLLWNMPELDPNKGSDARRQGLEVNKHDFKTYFFNYWAESLDAQYQSFIRDIVWDIPNNIMNKYIVGFIADKFKDELSRNYSLEEDEEAGNQQKQTANAKMATADALLKRITTQQNFSYNVSTGDLFYLIYLLQKDRLSPEKERLLFFIRSFYSMLLFEAYDVVTEAKGERYPAAPHSSGIYRIDERFKHTNELQNLVCGGFFTYRPGELLQNNDTGERFDTRVIAWKDGMDKAFKLCGEVVKNYDANVKELEALRKEAEGPDSIKTMMDIEEKLKESEAQFQLAEFLMMTISRSIIQKEIVNFNAANTSYRENVVPFALTTYNNKMGYYVFDIMQPFYSMVNPEFSYSRFNELAGVGRENGNALFEFALTHPFSLLRKMISATYGEKSETQDATVHSEAWLNALQSDAIIRNAEVLMAVFENASSIRDTIKDTYEFRKWTAFYNSITTTSLWTHSVGRFKEDKPYEIKFSFLKVLEDFIKEIVTLGDEAKDAPEYVKIFKETFRSVGESEKKSNKKASKKSDKKTNPYIKGSIVTILTKLLGEGPYTGKDIKEKLKQLEPTLRPLSDKDMALYLARQSDNHLYTMDKLATLISNKKEREEAWWTVVSAITNRNKTKADGSSSVGN